MGEADDCVKKRVVLKNVSTAVRPVSTALRPGRMSPITTIASVISLSRSASSRFVRIT